MRVEFRQGVPDGCIEWLYQHVGRGNLTSLKDSPDCDWFFERIEKEIPSTDPSRDYYNIRYVPTITVKDPKLATLFALRWT